MDLNGLSMCGESIHPLSPIISRFFAPIHSPMLKSFLLEAEHKTGKAINNNIQSVRLILLRLLFRFFFPHPSSLSLFNLPPSLPSAHQLFSAARHLSPFPSRHSFVHRQSPMPIPVVFHLPKIIGIVEISRLSIMMIVIIYYACNEHFLCEHGHGWQEEWNVGQVKDVHPTHSFVHARMACFIVICTLLLLFDLIEWMGWRDDG